ncbi:MAG: membrane dipeptidase [Arenicella sp.]|jgi:membrane dipeptidase
MLKKVIVSFFVTIELALLGLFSLAPTMTDKSLNAITPHQTFVVSDDAKALPASLTIGDWHSDSVLWGRDLGKRYDYVHVDIPRLQAGNVSLIVLS